ncbi:MAG: hypothetical protein WA071_10945 [Undibacterium umbellatum]|uniref:hypothetical protein n=1 Tax=Undibacterium umbellatum TaxID=2762300 RepID=UPI003BB69A9A
MKLSIEAPENEITQPGEIHLHIRFRPANMFGILLALLVHGLLLYFLLNMSAVKKKMEKAGIAAPMVLLMDKVAQAPKQATAPKKEKAPSKPVRVPPSKNAITQPKAPPPLPTNDSPVPQPPPPVANNVPPEMDMMAMANAARERRRAAEEAAAQENEGARQAGRGMTPQEVAEANVKRSMQQTANRGGGSGVFELNSVGTRVASFSFRGWNTRIVATGGKQSFEVDAGLGGDVRLAVVRRMIEIIRMEYKGDFNWESRRLGRVMVKSARVEDSAELESFLLKEFFP